MKHWMKEPLWVDALFQRRQDEMFDWLSQGASAELKTVALEFYMEDGPGDYLVPPFFLDMIRPRLERSTPLARGPIHENITFESQTQAVWWFDPEFPDQLWLSLSESFPAMFWVPTAPDDAMINAVYANNFAAQKTPVAQLENNFRMFAGTPDELQMELENFENHYVMTAPVSSHMWGSEFEYDPWPESTAGWAQINMIVEYRRWMVHRPGRVRRTSFRTSFSKSVLSVEHHPEGFVFDLRYHASPVESHIAAFNKTMGSDYPVDVPADLMAAVLGFRNITKGQIIPALDEGDYQYLWSDLKTLGAIEENPLVYEAHLKRWIEACDDLPARNAMTQAAYQFGADTLLYERWMIEPDPEIAAWLQAAYLPTEAA